MAVALIQQSLLLSQEHEGCTSPGMCEWRLRVLQICLLLPLWYNLHSLALMAQALLPMGNASIYQSGITVSSLGN